MQNPQELGSVTAIEMPQPRRAAGWKEQAVEEHERSLTGRSADLRAELAVRLMNLTGRRTSPDDVYVDQDARLGTVSVDGVAFRLYGRRLVLRRPCAYCGTSRFESPEITCLADLGYALSSWRPLHEECEDHDPHGSLHDS
jgi:hypothetical protein